MGQGECSAELVAAPTWLMVVAMIPILPTMLALIVSPRARTRLLAVLGHVVFMAYDPDRVGGIYKRGAGECVDDYVVIACAQAYRPIGSATEECSQ